MGDSTINIQSVIIPPYKSNKNYLKKKGVLIIINKKNSGLGYKIYYGIDKIITGSAILGAIFLIFIVSLVFYEVFVRFVLNSPTVWTLELTIYSLIASCFLSAGYLVRVDKHIRVDVIIESVPFKIKKVMFIIGCLIGLLFSIILAWQGIVYVISSFQLDFRSLSSLRLPMYIPHMLIPIGGILLSLSFILQLIDIIFNDGERLDG